MPIDMQALARAGATTRLTELRQEIADLHAAFPDLDGASAARKRGRAPRKAASTGPAARGRKRKGMSAAARKAVSVRMASYWGRRKALAAAPAAEAPSVTATTAEASEKPADERTMSADARARISAAQKKRWAGVKRGRKR